MRFSYLVNLDDFKEAVQSKSPLGKPARPGFVLLNGLFVFGICLVSALPRTQLYAETPNLLLLITKAGDTMFMPKRAVDESAMDELKMLISEHIAEGSFDKGTAAFPVLMPPC